MHDDDDYYEDYRTPNTPPTTKEIIMLYAVGIIIVLFAAIWIIDILTVLYS